MTRVVQSEDRLKTLDGVPPSVPGQEDDINMRLNRNLGLNHGVKLASYAYPVPSAVSLCGMAQAIAPATSDKSLSVVAGPIWVCSHRSNSSHPICILCFTDTSIADRDYSLVRRLPVAAKIACQTRRMLNAADCVLLM